jgi:mannose-6-phosphate isomerase-like protein (cupin superfamily)
MTNSCRASVVAILVLLPCASLSGQSKPAPPVVGITSAEIEAVLKHTGPEGSGVDRQIKVADLGAYKVGVGVLRRGPTKPGAPVAAITHSQVTEVFYVISGSGTLVTGGPIDNDRAFPPETEFVRLAVGPSSGGVFKGGDRRRLGPGDVVVVPAGVPHGFDDVTTELTYLSMRPDMTGVLPAGYVHPALKKE